MPLGASSRRGPVVVEPIGFAVSQFLGSVGLVAGIGLAPDGLLLFAAAVLLSIIDLRRFGAANPGLIPEDASGFETPRGKVLFRLSLQSTVVLALLCGLALYSVHHYHERAASLGPALVGGAVTLWFNWRLKRGLTRIAVAEVLAHRAVEDAEKPYVPVERDEAWYPGDTEDPDDPAPVVVDRDDD